MNEEEQARVRLTVSCRDTDYIPKVDGAGTLSTSAQGERVQQMHNGLHVLADRYYGDFITEIIQGLKGHHEPQEEKVFHEILKAVRPGTTMIELGAYWSYYSAWFQTVVKEATNLMVEPDAANLEVGRRNFELNGLNGTFIQALAGASDSTDTQPRTVSVDGLIAAHGIDRLEILHSDIQGAEHKMLSGARRALEERRVRFVVISTHGYRMHARCLGFLRRHGYRVFVEHTPAESFSFDGLIAATCDASFDKQITISHRPLGLGHRARSFLCRVQSRFVG